MPLYKVWSSVVIPEVLLPGIILCVIALSSFSANPNNDGGNTLKFQVSFFIEPAQWKLFGLTAISYTEAKSSPSITNFVLWNWVVTSSLWRTYSHSLIFAKCQSCDSTGRYRIPSSLISPYVPFTFTFLFRQSLTCRQPLQFIQHRRTPFYRRGQ